jgi:hypothetical protein
LTGKTVNILTPMIVIEHNKYQGLERAIDIVQLKNNPSCCIAFSHCFVYYAGMCFLGWGENFSTAISNPFIFISNVLFCVNST